MLYTKHAWNKRHKVIHFDVNASIRLNRYINIFIANEHITIKLEFNALHLHCISINLTGHVLNEWLFSMQKKIHNKILKTLDFIWIPASTKIYLEPINRWNFKRKYISLRQTILIFNIELFSTISIFWLLITVITKPLNAAKNNFMNNVDACVLTSNR